MEAKIWNIPRSFLFCSFNDTISLTRAASIPFPSLNILCYWETQVPLLTKMLTLMYLTYLVLYALNVSLSSIKF